MDHRTQEVLIGATGEVLGTEADPTVGATFVGEGQVDNGGVIALSADRMLGGGVTVSGHHYAVSFDTHGGTPVPAPVTVFAPSLATGYRGFPAADPTREPDFFQGWTTEADGAGDPFTAGSTLPGTSGDGAAVPVVVHAWWAATPPPCIAGAEVFGDVDAADPFCGWIEELAARGITAGCTTTRYCPNNPVTRAQMAVFLLRTI